MPRRSKRKAPLPLKPRPGSRQSRALNKVGTAELSRLAWLVETINRDDVALAQLSDPEREKLAAEIAVFCRPIGAFVAAHNPALAAESIERLLRQARQAIFALGKGASYDLRIPEVTLALIPDAEPCYFGSPEAVFNLALAKLIETDGQRIRQCARAACGKLFVRRKRALYCGTHCSQIEQFARYINRHA